MPRELNARFCVTAVKLCVQSERILTSTRKSLPHYGQFNYYRHIIFI